MDSEERKKPEFIYIEEPYQQQNFGSEEQRLFTAMHQMHEVKFPITMRILAFFGSIFAAVVAAFLAVAAAFWFVFAAGTLFQVDWIAAPFKRTFSLFKKTLMVAIGLLIGVFIPPMGIAFIALYFLMNGEEFSGSVLQKMYGRFGPPN